MSKIEFKNLGFEIVDGRIFLTKFGNLSRKEGQELGDFTFCEVSISGENKNTHLGAKMVLSTEWDKLKYISHAQQENRLEVVLRSEKVQAKVVFDGYEDTNAIRVHTEYTNVSGEEIWLEEASAFTIHGLGTIKEDENLKFTKFTQSHHNECQPRTFTFKEHGLFRGTGASQRKISHANVGSWSTKEELPQGIIEAVDGKLTMFQIESSNSWYYEIGDKSSVYYLYLGGANSTYGSWSKKLANGETYTTINVALSFGDDLSDVVGNMTAYRRHIMGRCASDEHLPTIFNEYMHLSWDNPSEENTKTYAPVAKLAGVEYYVIDCGWHDEVPTHLIYHYVGNWKESNLRFPSGVKKTTDYIRSLGLKPGLWIEPEVVGFKNQEMIDYYGEDAFIKRNGKIVTVMNRLILDYRHPKVVEYMSETIRRMVEDYGAEYIKMDYNQDLGVGTEVNSDSFGEGLESSANAFANWVKAMTERFPHVVFEGCSSGGMRMDYKTLSLYPLVSTSDQVDCYKYPYIACNILSAVAPEQSAVWSYPVGGINGECLRDVTKEWTDQNVDEDRVAVNMINSFLGRMHLASNISRLDGKRLDLVKEGVAYYNALTPFKKKALPYFPIGFTNMEEKTVCSGLKDKNSIRLAVYNLDGELAKTIAVCGKIKSARVGYPTSSKVKLGFDKNLLKVEFTRERQAVFVEVEVE
ncbi:MAG: alpha-galactosidase [Clostridia bacterium]|nr:alpha-galactosidase [Clostridia bacterium]